MGDMDSSYVESEDTEKFKNKLIKDPMVSLGLVAILGIVGFGAYSIKNSKGKRLSLQLIHLRLAAQGTFISCLTAGVIYTFCKKHLNLFAPEKKD